MTNTAPGIYVAIDIWHAIQHNYTPPSERPCASMSSIWLF